MTKEELAKLLDGKEYRDEVLGQLYEDAIKAGLVVVYGASDDLMEFEGVIDDEFGCYGGGECRVDADGVVPDREMMEDVEDDEEAMEAWLKRKKAAKQITAVWSAKGQPPWTYKTKIPHATFTIMEDGEVQCRGLVFNIADL